jgi:putative ABC transport system permease protein
MFGGAVTVVAWLAGVFGPHADREAALTTAAVALAVAATGSVVSLGRRTMQFVGRPISRTGVPGALAVGGLARHRGVIGPTAALAVGLGLVAAVGVLSSSTSASIGRLVRRTDRADMVVVGDAAPGLDPEAVEALRTAPAVQVVTELGADAFTVAGRSFQFTALDTDTAAQTLSLPTAAGSLKGFGDGDIAVTRTAAASNHLQVGDFVRVQFGIPQHRELKVTAVVEDNGITRDWIVPFETYRRGFVSAPIRTVFVKAVVGTDPARLRREVDVGVRGFPGVSVYDAATYAQAQARSAEGPVRLVEALVGLAIVMALIGVMDALGLAVVERTSEIGLLRAVGMSAHQVSRTVQWEALLMATVGVLFGVVGGVSVGWALVSAVSLPVVVPLRVIALAAALVVLGSLAAASWPAYRAARLGVLEAIARPD